MTWPGHNEKPRAVTSSTGRTFLDDLTNTLNHRNEVIDCADYSALNLVRQVSSEVHHELDISPN